MSWSTKLFGAFACTAVLIVAAVAEAAPPQKKTVQKPQQIIPTGAEDAPPTKNRTTLRAERQRQTDVDAELEAMTSRSSEGLVPVKRRDGVIALDLEGRFMHVSLAYTTSDGQTVRTCSAGSDVITRLLAAHAVKPAAKPQTQAPQFQIALEVQ